MNELQEHQPTFPWNTEVQMLEVPAVVIAGSVDRHEDSAQSSDDVDTSFVPAAEDRVVESPAEAPAAADSIKKPPTDKPGGRTTFEDPDDYNENLPNEAAEVLGAVATSAETTTDAEATQPVSDNLEVIQNADGSTTIVNKAHNQPALLEEVITRLEDGEPWTELPLRNDPEYERKYFVDNAKTPAFFAKVTPQLDGPEGRKEIELASHVQSVITSEQAQRIAQEHGFSSVSYVEPLVVVDKPGEHQTIVYPYQAGEQIVWSDDPVEAARESELSEVVHELNGLLGANGVDACDIDHYQFLAEGNNLHLLDTELYDRFESPPPTLASGEMSHSMHGRWQGTTESTEIYQGESVVARQAEDGSGVQLSTDLQEGYVVALWNTHTSESALLHVQSSIEADEQIRELTERVPSLVSRSTIARIVGPADVSIDRDIYPVGINVETAVSIRSKASQISLFDPTGASRVSIDTGSGSVEVTTEAGDVKRFNPPKRIS